MPSSEGCTAGNPSVSSSCTGQVLPDYYDGEFQADPVRPACDLPCQSDPKADTGLLASCSTLRLEDLQPDVLYQVLLFLSNQDMARLKQASSRLRSNTLQACQHWAPKVEGWLLADPNSGSLLRRLRELHPQLLAAGQQQLSSAALPPTSCEEAAPAAPAADPGGALAMDEDNSSSSSSSCGVEPDVQQQQLMPAAPVPQVQPESSVQQQPVNAAALGRLARRLDWRQLWSCIQRAQQGPWQLDVRALAPALSPHGVLLTFELLLQQPAPLEASSCEQQTVGWKDSVTVMSFVLDKKVVDIVVDASGRVTSPQRDWCQGCIQLQPGQPRLLALEVSYIFPVPAWFLHPCTLAAPRPASTSSSGSSSCASSVSGMTLDQTWDSYSISSSMSISQSAVLCSAAASGHGDTASLASSSLSSSSSFGNCTTLSSASSTPMGGRPRLSLDLSIGFGSYVIDPRYIDEASPNLMHRGLERMELAARVCWRPSKVQSWLGRLLPGIRSHACSNSGNITSSSSNTGGNSPRAAGVAGSAAAVCSASSGGKQGAKPSFAVTLSKAAAWQVPADTDRRFAEGFMFWAVQHKLELLLEQYGVLPRELPVAAAACGS